MADAVEAADAPLPPVSAVFVENTHMPAGGTPVARWSDSRGRRPSGVPVHLDGARLFNAEVATGCRRADCWPRRPTTVMCCLSKGLAAPVGSLLAGPADLIAEARGERKRLGGAMRQAGVIAAAGLVALEQMVERLAEDHRRARRLAEAVAERWPDGERRPDAVVTNMVLFGHPDPATLIAG